MRNIRKTVVLLGEGGIGRDDQEQWAESTPIGKVNGRPIPLKADARDTLSPLSLMSIMTFLFNLHDYCRSKQEW